MFGLHPDGSETPAQMDLVRLAIPRRVYTQSHIDYVAEGVVEVARTRDRLRGYRIVSAPNALRHFTARFEPVGSGSLAAFSSQYVVSGFSRTLPTVRLKADTTPF